MALETVIKKLQAAQQRLAEDAKREIVDAVREAMPAWASRVEWTQYTDYFNDGEACTFSVHEVSAVDTEGNRVDLYEDNCSPEQSRDLSEIEKIRDTFGEDLLLAAFDDHVKITVTRQGYSVNHHDHE